ncbi:serine hydrolase domain-containing protein [Streptomyces sp. NPDC058953]|uniref:serine hydrolase domain-containing protein n=1 Tax=Streptomyces sp. NPDC058953 TaxID=3346676 RepID=UPI0036853BD3
MRSDDFADTAYVRVREAFDGLIRDGREPGAGLSVWRAGREVLRLSGGWADSARTRPFDGATLVQPYSVSKPFAAVAARVAVRDGALELDRPIAGYWPEYGRAGKDRVTLRQVLSHRAGQPRFPEAARGVDPLDGAALRASLAAAAPEYEPGTAIGEHALTYGHLIDGALRAGAGTTLGELFNEVVRPALGLDAWFGVPERELRRVADLEYLDPGWAEQLPSAPWLRIPAGPLDPDTVNSAVWRRSAFGAVNLHTNASSVARFFAGLTGEDGPMARLLGPEVHREFLAPQVTGHDEVFGTELTWTLGLLRDRTKIAKGGIGGSAGWWSFERGHGVAYLTRGLADHARVAAIATALGDDLSVTPLES